MCANPIMPNAENCSLAELYTAARAARSKRSHMRLMAIKALLMNFTHDQVAGLYEIDRRTLSSWVNKFNRQGIDGLIEKNRPGRPSKIGDDKTAQYKHFIENPQSVNQSHWTARKFHGYLTKELDQEIGYSTVVRWLHDQGFCLKVPRSWPDRQDEEKRKIYLEKLKELLQEPDIDLWYLDETGIEGDPRPRNRWAQKGEKLRHPYEGTHIRQSATGTVCPRTGEFYALIYSHSDSQTFQSFLENANQDIRLERKRNILILDNASWHKGKRIKWGNFEPFYLPPYSPDLNPIERLWNLMKAEWFCQFFAKTQVQLIDQLCKALNWITDRGLLNQKTCSIRKEF